MSGEDESVKRLIFLIKVFRYDDFDQHDVAYSAYCLELSLDDSSVNVCDSSLNN